MNFIDTDNLRSFFDEKQAGSVVHVLGADRYDAAHIPGSVNVSLAAPEFVARVGSNVENKDSTVIVYSDGPGCDASTIAAHKLMDAGYTDVRCYAPGIEGWRDAGLPLRGNQVPADAN
ncbi:MAG: rhodanese-like domain-containing protein [Phycisphaerales bacterium]